MISLPTAFLPNLPYLFLIARKKVDGICVGEQYKKQTYRNRAELMGANGRVTFSVPVQKIGYPSPATLDVYISEHGQWRCKLWQMLRSNYCSTPYWEHYCDAIKAQVYNPTPRLVDYNHSWLTLLCSLIGIEAPPLIPNSVGLLTEPSDFIDPTCPIFTRRYWQVFDHKFGFQPNLSALDMLLCIGPESRLILFADVPNASHGLSLFQG